MGLESVELLMEVEKTFDIQVPDSEAKSIKTVGDFYNSVWDKIKDKENKKCMSAMVYYRFRKLIVSKIGIQNKDLKLDTDINDLIPREIRKSKWIEIQTDFEYKLPSLDLPQRLNRLLTIIKLSIVIISILISVFLFSIYDKPKSYFFLIPIIGLSIVHIIIIVSTPYRTDIKQDSVRELIKYILFNNYHKISLSYGSNRLEMENVISNIIHENFGIDYELIKPEAAIVNDLGIN